MIKEFVLDLKSEFQGYNSKKVIKDLMAGMAVAAVALPLALAFGLSAGATAAAGMVTAIFAGIVIGFLGGAPFQVSGPTGAMVAVLTGIIYQHGMEGVFVAGFLAGIMLILAGIFKMGKIVEFIPAPVIVGFTSGIACIIGLGEVDNLLGVSTTGENVFAQCFNIFQNVVTGEATINFYALTIGVLVAIVMLIWPKKWGEKVPASIVCIGVAMIANIIFKFPVATIGEIPQTLVLPERMGLSSLLNFDLMKEMLIPAISVAALAMIESLLCGVTGSRMGGGSVKFRGDRELVAQGVGNLIMPFVGGIPANAALARSSMAVKSGCETRMTVIFHSVGLLASMFLLGGVMSQIPFAALSGILIAIGIKMNDWVTIKYMFGKKIYSAVAGFAVTLLATVVLDLALAIVIGLVLSSFFFMMRVANIDINFADVDYVRLQKKGVEVEHTDVKAKVVYISGSVFFGAVDNINIQMTRLSKQDLLIFSMRGVPVVDTSGGQALEDLCRKYLDQGTVVMFSGVQPKVMKSFEVDGILDLVGKDNFYWDAKDAIVAYDQRLSQKVKSN